MVQQSRRVRARAPRVQIAYDLDVAGETRRKELPFVLGVLGDFAGSPQPPPPKLRDREFVEVSRANFNTVLKNMQPHLNLRVANRLASDDSKLAVTLRFESLDDFAPEQVAQQVEPLRQLIVLRRQLAALRAALDAPQRRQPAATRLPAAGATNNGDGSSSRASR